MNVYQTVVNLNEGKTNISALYLLNLKERKKLVSIK